MKRIIKYLILLSSLNILFGYQYIDDENTVNHLKYIQVKLNKIKINNGENLDFEVINLTKNVVEYALAMEQFGDYLRNDSNDKFYKKYEWAEIVGDLYAAPNTKTTIWFKLKKFEKKHHNYKMDYKYDSLRLSVIYSIKNIGSFKTHSEVFSVQ
jgi:uncharacterized membrane protein